MRLDIGKVATVSLARWQRQSAAEARTPWALRKEHRQRYVKLLRLGSLRVLDWGDGPRLDPGTGVMYGAQSGIAALRIPTDKDAAAIEEARRAVLQAEQALQQLCQRAYGRGRMTTLDEVMAASEQVRQEVGE